MKTLGVYLNNDDQNKLRIGIQRGMYNYFLKAYSETEYWIRISYDFHVTSTNEQSSENQEQNLKYSQRKGDWKVAKGY